MIHQKLAHCQCSNLIVILVSDSTIIWPLRKHLLMLMTLINYGCLCASLANVLHCGTAPSSNISTIRKDEKEQIIRCNVFLHKISQDAIFQTCRLYPRHTLPLGCPRMTLWQCGRPTRAGWLT